jgi:hypothetical protein
MSEACVWAYAVGHVMNDATAACWFSYLLILLENVSAHFHTHPKRNMSVLAAIGWI